MLLLASTFREERPPDIAVRAWNEISRGVHSTVADYWHEKILPRHFTPDAAKKYGHKPRSRKYLLWKARQRGAGRVDNVLWGDMQDMLQRRAVIRSFPSRSTLTMTGPRYMTMRAFGGDHKQAAAQGWTYGKNQRFSATAGRQPDKKAEVTKVIESERQELARVMDEDLQKRIDAYRQRKVETP